MSSELIWYRQRADKAGDISSLIIEEAICSVIRVDKEESRLPNWWKNVFTAIGEEDTNIKWQVNQEYEVNSVRSFTYGDRRYEFYRLNQGQYCRILVLTESGNLVVDKLNQRHSWLRVSKYIKIHKSMAEALNNFPVELGGAIRQAFVSLRCPKCEGKCYFSKSDRPSYKAHDHGKCFECSGSGRVKVLWN